MHWKNEKSCVGRNKNLISHHHQSSQICLLASSKRQTQKLDTAAMAAHTILSFSSPSRPLSSSFRGVSLNLHRPQSVSFSARAPSSKRALTVVSAAKKAVAVLKGTSDVEGVVTLTQDDSGFPPFLPHDSISFYIRLPFSESHLAIRSLIVVLIPIPYN